MALSGVWVDVTDGSSFRTLMFVSTALTQEEDIGEQTFVELAWLESVVSHSERDLQPNLQRAENRQVKVH